MAALTLVAIVATTVAAAASLGGVAAALLAPLAAWTAFATYLNIYDAVFSRPDLSGQEDRRSTRSSSGTI